MNLENITLKSYILALIIRDDGERFLLGDGAYEFKQNQLHFNPNTYANDVVELQGSDGQMLAGQVRRTQTQTFDGYIGDATTSKDKVEQYRRAFFMFFRKKHYYTVAYIFANGSSIQRRRGYITDAPSVQELWQKFPEYHIGLNFEDPNYYEYAEDENGNEVYAHIMSINLSSNITGGLIWDAIGAVSNAINWKSAQAAQGTYINITNSLDIPAALSEVEIKGNSVQSGTPTPDAPIPVQTTTGENDVEIVGKNLFSGFATLATNSTFANGTLTMTHSATNTSNDFEVSPNTLYYLNWTTGAQTRVYIREYDSSGTQLTNVTKYVPYGFTTTATTAFIRVYFSPSTSESFPVSIKEIQLELGSTATDYEPYQGQTLPVNLGKNLLQPMTGLTNQGLTGTVNSDGTITVTGTATNNYAFITDTTTQNIPAGTYMFSDGLVGQTYRCIARFTYTDNTYVECDLRSQGAGRSVTLAQTAIKCQIRLTNITSGTTYNITVKPQVELGSTATDYAPYFTPIELCKIGTYQDKIYKSGGKWYVRKEVGKVVLDGTETGWNLSSGTNRYSFWRHNSSFSNALAQPYQKLCDNFVYDSGVFNSTASIPSLCENSIPTTPLFIFNTDGTQGTTIPQWQTWLSTHNTTVYYALATPTDTEITNSALIEQLEALGNSKLYVGANNITTTYTEGNAQATLKLGYYTDYDMDGTGYEWEDGGNPRNIVSVDGVDDAQPIWEVVGPAQNPTITNITTGQTLTWNGFVPSGQTLTVDMGEMTATLAGANVFEYISGTWITLDAGNNIITYSASGGATDPSTLSWNGVVG